MAVFILGRVTGEEPSWVHVERKQPKAHGIFKLSVDSQGHLEVLGAPGTGESSHTHTHSYPSADFQ